jgi:G3E family GTPase
MAPEQANTVRHEDGARRATGAVPFTILTGYLGAGKTTALNRMLGQPLGRRIAVLVNELGRVAIDGRLIARAGGDVLELAGGCVCCKIDVKNDLWDGIADVVARSAPDHLVLETTGIAEPPALVAGLERLPEPMAGRIALAGDERRAFLELAGTQLALGPGPPWTAGEPRRSELVFIGDDLDDDLIAGRLWACRANAAD